MNKHLVNLTRSVLLRKSFRALRLNRLYNKWLSIIPRYKDLYGITYRSTRTESVSLAIEILEGGNCYDSQYLPNDFTTFADLGCNVGYFTVWLNSHTDGRRLKGLMVDANQSVIDESKYHCNVNHWDDIVPICGIVGAPTSDFYIHEANTVSTANLGYRNPKDYNRVDAKVIDNFEQLWIDKMGDISCDILKVDIEGAELPFLIKEFDFLKRVKVFYLEYHKQFCTFANINYMLIRAGFILRYHNNDINRDDGVVVYTRQ